MKNSSISQNQIQGQSQVGFPTFADIRRHVEERIELDCFPKEYLSQAREFCLIIAEVYMLPATAEIQIAGQKLPVLLVQSIYDMLEHEDVLAVMDCLERATYEIKHKKTYVRTALYNAVFERETRSINELRVLDGPHGYIGTRKDRK